MMTFNGRRTQIITGRSEAAVEVVKDDFLVDEMREVRRAEVVTEAAIAPDNDFLGWVTSAQGQGKVLHDPGLFEPTQSKR